MGEIGTFTGEITPDNVVSNAKLASEKLREEGLAEPKSIKYHFPPITHERSNARYIAEQPIGENKEHILYVAVMGPNGSTTRHFHGAPVVEKYLPIAGQLFVNGKPVPQEGIDILPGEVHQATTKDEGSLTVVFMKNGATMSAENRHIQVVDKE